MFVGNSIYAGGQFAMLCCWPSWFGRTGWGKYALGLAVVYPVMMLTNLQLRAVMTSALAGRQILAIYLKPPPADDVAGTHDYLRHHPSPKV